MKNVVLLKFTLFFAAFNISGIYGRPRAREQCPEVRPMEMFNIFEVIHFIR